MSGVIRREEFLTSSLDLGTMSVDLQDYATTGLRIVTVGPSGIGKTNAGLLIPSGGDVVRIDTKNGRVLKYYNANVDAIWGLNSVAFSPKVSQLTYLGTRDPIPGDQDCGDGPCQRFGLYSESMTAKKKIPHLIVKDTGPASFSPDGKDLVYVAGGGLVIKPVGSGLVTSIATTGATPTIAAPPTWR